MKKSELIFNKDGSVYHLKLKKENVSTNIILVGDPSRVELITNKFDSVEKTIENREFKTSTGSYNNRRITVISTGIGSSNIDIVLNELDALFNIDFKTLKAKKNLTKLNFIRIGTSGSIQKDINIDTLLISKKAIDIDGFMNNYELNNSNNSNFTKSFIKHYEVLKDKNFPICFDCSEKLFEIFEDLADFKGITITCNGFYGSQGRNLRMISKNKNFITQLKTFNFQGYSLTNLEMETAIIYGMSKILGHHAISLNAILANREIGTYSDSPDKTIDKLICKTLYKLSNNL